MGKKMMHIGLEPGEVGRYVFLPGSPERTEKIAAYFDNPKEIAYNREFRTFVGELDGVKVAVTSTGIGGPFRGNRSGRTPSMLRVGTCASTSEKVSLGDVVIPNGAVRMEGVSTHYLPIEYPAVPDFQVVKAVEQAAQKLEFPYNVGVTITKASFYTQTTPETKRSGRSWSTNGRLRKGGATSTSMECSVLFCVGVSLGIRTSSVMISATNFGEYSNDADDYPSGWEERAIEVGIETMKIMIRKDKAAANKQ